MSKTIVDMPKVTQMLDAGWTVQVRKNPMRSYTAMAKHDDVDRVPAANRKLLASTHRDHREMVKMGLEERYVETDDFTPEQALTRLAYKVAGEWVRDVGE